MGKPVKLKVVPKQYRAYVDQEHWDEFVNYRLSDEFKYMSEAAKEARAKSMYPHRLGQSGYSGLRERFVKDKELHEDELPSWSFMWRKARMSKDGDYKDNDLMVIANKIVDHEKEIQDGCIKRDHGTNALTLVFGKKHGGRVRGISTGVTPSKYWHIPPHRRSSKEFVTQLRMQLDNERRERELKIEEVKDLKIKIGEQGQQLRNLCSRK